MQFIFIFQSKSPYCLNYMNIMTFLSQKSKWRESNHDMKRTLKYIGRDTIYAKLGL